MDIAVIGTGYVGLVTGACFADMGNSVICVENNLAKLEQLKKGSIPIFEPGLEEIVLNNIEKHRLDFTSDISYAVKKSDICFIAVGTPQAKDGSADLSGVFQVVEDIAKSMNGYKIVVNKSTVPVGTGDKIKEIIKANTSCNFDIVSNPEFLKQGNAVDDFLYPNRVIIGTESEKVIQIMYDIYAPFLRTGNQLLSMDIKSAEMTKYVANAFLATKISFMNEMANLCECNGANIDMVRLGISSDERIGNKFLFSGLGFGGSCFPKDLKAIVKMGYEIGCEMKLIQEIENINISQRERFVQKITKYFGENLVGKTFGVWGLAFKPQTNDMREAPSITVINSLLAKGAKIQAFDPKAMKTAKMYFGDNISYCENSYDALNNVDAMLLITEWNEFRNPDFDRIKSLLKTPVIFDGRNQYDKDLLKEKGFEYFCVGK